jgi:Xaa-Pro aminopeptidase
MNSSALARFAEFCQERKLSSALLSNPATVAWLTGYAPPIQTGPNPFEGGPALAWWQDGRLKLVLSDGEAGAARGQGVEVCEYVAYTIEGPAAGFQNQGAVLSRLLHAATGTKGIVGVELNFLPASLLGLLQDALPLANVMPLDGSFELLRAIKTHEELERIRAALSLCDLAQAETRRLMKPGISEIDLWGQVKAQLEIAAASRLPVLADFIGGARTAEIGGLPGSYVLSEGNPLIADIVPRLNGYWGDNCGTHFIGEPSAEMAKAYRVVREALRAGIAAIRPGVRACDLDYQLRRVIQDGGYAAYPHHSGHGLGSTYHEEPRIIPYNTLTLQPGMVIALEPGVYIPDQGGVRLEDVVLVTEDGAEVLTRHLANS